MGKIKILINLIKESTKAKIITGVVSAAVVGTAGTAGYIHHVNSVNATAEANKAKNKSAVVSTNTAKADTNKDDKIADTKDVDEEKEETKKASDEAKKQALSEGKSEKEANEAAAKAVAKVAKKYEGRKSSGSAKTPTQTASKPQTPQTQPKTPQTPPTPPKAPETPKTPQTPPTPPKPKRASGIDQALTDKLNAEGQTLYAYNSTTPNGKTSELIQSAKNIVLGGSVVNAIKTPWLSLPGDEASKMVYKGHSVNIVTGEKNYYYTRLPQWKNGIDGFTYVVAYWDASINNYKLYYIRITLI